MGISKEALRISPESCPELAILGRKHSWEHGPHALVELRNNIVHPEDKYYNMFQRAYYEAWNLAQWYLELTLLKLCGYEGNYAIASSGEIAITSTAEVARWSLPFPKCPSPGAPHRPGHARIRLRASGRLARRKVRYFLLIRLVQISPASGLLYNTRRFVGTVQSQTPNSR